METFVIVVEAMVSCSARGRFRPGSGPRDSRRCRDDFEFTEARLSESRTRRSAQETVKSMVTNWYRARRQFSWKAHAERILDVCERAVLSRRRGQYIAAIEGTGRPS